MYNAIVVSAGQENHTSFGHHNRQKSYSRIQRNQILIPHHVSYNFQDHNDNIFHCYLLPSKIHFKEYVLGDSTLSLGFISMFNSTQILTCYIERTRIRILRSSDRSFRISSIRSTSIKK